LSQIANSYEKYRIKSMTFRYVANCSTSTAGFVYIIPDYDVNDEESYDPKEFLNMMDTVQGACWVNKALRVRPKKPNQIDNYLVRSPYKDYTDYLMYDPVNVYIGTEDSALVSGKLGKIFVDYVIELMIPDPDNQLKLWNFSRILTGVEIRETAPSSGIWLPRPNTGITSTTAYFGNMKIPPTLDGWVFPEGFCGYVHVFVIASHFDATRQLRMALSSGVGIYFGSSLQDQDLGTDIWSLSYGFKCGRGATISFIGASSNEDVSAELRITGSSCNPRWFNAIAPNVTDAELVEKTIPPSRIYPSSHPMAKPTPLTKREILEMLLSIDEDSFLSDKEDL
jgi:hypothetical protein